MKPLESSEHDFFHDEECFVINIENLISMTIYPIYLLS